MALYGDVMTALTYTLFLPMYMRSYCTTDPGLRVGVFTSNTLFRWPFGDESMLMPQFFWTVIIHISSNLALDASTKVAMIVYAFIWAAFSTILTDNPDTASTLLICIFSSMLAIALHIRAESSKWKDELRSARLAALILGTVYAHQLASEIIRIAQVPGYATTGGYNMVKMGFLASMGIIATGIFQDQVSIKRSLLSLVQTKGDEMAHQAEIMEMISMALEKSETAIAITHADHSMIWANQALQKFIGPSFSGTNKLCGLMQLTGEPLDLFRSCFRESREKSVELVLNEKEIKMTVAPFTISRRNSQPASVDFRYLVSLSDISQLRARERAEKAAEQAAVQRMAMQESMETLTHELRTPLQGIIGMTSLVFDSSHQVSQEEMYECLNTVMASSRLLLTLINNLLDCHKMDANMMDSFQLFAFRLADAMKDAAHYCHPIAALNDTNPQLCLDFDESENILVRSNPIRFQQVLVNLVSNAIKYAGQGSIKIRAEVASNDEANERIRHALARGCDPLEVTSPTSRVAIISVEDSGDGIPLEMISRVFQKFSQYSDLGKACDVSSHSSIYPSGTGIGLNLCRRFVERMGGNIWVANKASNGACFSFCLAVLDSSSIAACEPGESMTLSIPAVACAESETPQQSANSISQSMALKILVVDDTIINLKVIERMIKRSSPKFQVTTAESGAKALEAVNRQHFDLVITDLQMPECDGFELSRVIQTSTKIFPKPVVVALTAETSESLYSRCSAVGMSHILYKPLSNQQLQTFLATTLPTLKHCELDVDVSECHEN